MRRSVVRSSSRHVSPVPGTVLSNTMATMDLGKARYQDVNAQAQGHAKGSNCRRARSRCSDGDHACRCGCGLRHQSPFHRSRDQGNQVMFATVCWLSRTLLIFHPTLRRTTNGPQRSTTMICQQSPMRYTQTPAWLRPTFHHPTAIGAPEGALRSCASLLARLRQPSQMYLAQRLRWWPSGSAAPRRGLGVSSSGAGRYPRHRALRPGPGVAVDVDVVVPLCVAGGQGLGIPRQAGNHQAITSGAVHL